MPLRVGDRVEVSGQRGTVRFIGSVEGYSGEWVGMEWDDATRGKHDGTVNGVRYFTTSHKTGGSLVRPKLVRVGEEFVATVLQKYADDEENEDSGLVWGNRAVNLVNLRKGKPKQRRSIVLTDSLVSHSSLPSPDPAFPHCLELNLDCNLLSRWSEVMNCLRHTPNCRELIIGGNIMEHVQSAEQLTGLAKAEKVQILVLAKCLLDQTTITLILGLFPGLKELYATQNCLHSFSLPSPSTCAYTLVDLESNSIRSFDDIRQLALLPNLEKLSLASCALTEIRLPRLGGEGEGTVGDVGYRNLHTLNVKHNNIRDWSSIDELRLLDKLTTLYIDLDKFHAEFGMDSREVIIAKLPKLCDLERYKLSEVERRSAEIRFLNKYSSLSEERRRREGHEGDLERLEKIHGPPVLDNARLKQLSIVRVAFERGDKRLPPRALPTSLTVARMLDMARRLFALGRDEEVEAELDQNGYRMPLDNPMRQLAYYQPQDDDVIRIS